MSKDDDAPSEQALARAVKEAVASLNRTIQNAAKGGLNVKIDQYTIHQMGSPTETPRIIATVSKPL